MASVPQNLGDTPADGDFARYIEQLVGGGSAVLPRADAQAHAAHTRSAPSAPAAVKQPARQRPAGPAAGRSAQGMDARRILLGLSILGLAWIAIPFLTWVLVPASGLVVPVLVFFFLSVVLSRIIRRWLGQQK